MPVQRYAVVGGGIIGTAVARRLLAERPDAEVTVLEKEHRLAAHQTGRNSGVVHAGLYYEPGSLKATLCRRGVALLKEFCAERGLPYDEIGKVLVALDGAEEQRLGAIAERARANGVSSARSMPASSSVPATRNWSPRRETAILHSSSIRLMLGARSGCSSASVAL